MKIILYIYIIITALNFAIFWLNIKVGMTNYIAKMTDDQLERYNNRKKNLASDVLCLIKMFCLSAVPLFNILLLLCFLFKKDFFEFKADFDKL